jgi:hypothetical protein
MKDIPDILVLAPAFYPSVAPVWRLCESAAAHNIPLRLYGVGEPYKGWVDVQITRLWQELEHATEEYFLYTDAIDAFFVAGLDEIWQKYDGMGRPSVLFPWEPSGLNAGGVIGQREYFLKAMAGITGLTDGDPQVRWRTQRWPVDTKWWPERPPMNM